MVSGFHLCFLQMIWHKKLARLALRLQVSAEKRWNSLFGVGMSRVHLHFDAVPFTEAGEIRLS